MRTQTAMVLFALSLAIPTTSWLVHAPKADSATAPSFIESVTSPITLSKLRGYASNRKYRMAMDALHRNDEALAVQILKSDPSAAAAAKSVNELIRPIATYFYGGVVLDALRKELKSKDLAAMKLPNPQDISTAGALLMAEADRIGGKAALAKLIKTL